MGLAAEVLEAEAPEAVGKMFNWFRKLKKEAKVDESNRICPKCITRMDKVIKGDIIIDVCPKCNGIWLDDQEIEKLIEYAKNQEKTKNTEKSNSTNSKIEQKQKVESKTENKKLLKVKK